MSFPKSRIRLDWIDPWRHSGRAAEIKADAEGVAGPSPVDRAERIAALDAHFREYLTERQPIGSSPLAFATGKVAIVRREVVGYAIVEIDSWKVKGGDPVPFVTLIDLAVAPASQRRGVGSALLANILEEYVDRIGLDFFALVPADALPAQVLMRSVGRGRPGGPIPAYTREAYARDRARIAPCRSAAREFDGLLGVSVGRDGVARLAEGPDGEWDSYLFLRSSKRFALTPAPARV